MWLLVTGTGRCGTGYLAQVLTSAGVQCGHQKVFNLGGWEGALRAMDRWPADSSWLAVPFLDRPELKHLTVVHLVRHPKETIDAFRRVMFHDTITGDDYYCWMCERLPELDEYDSLVDRAACWVLRLNEMSERRADLRHRLEDETTGLLASLNIDWQGKRLFDDTHYNSQVGFGPSNVVLNDISQPLRDQLIEMSERYGYVW